MQYFFTEEQLKDPKYCLSGQNPKGSQMSAREPLDPILIEHIKYLVLGSVQGNEAQKELQWKQCKKAMNKKIWELKHK